VFSLPLLSAFELQQVVLEWNDTSTGWRVAGGAVLHELIEWQALRTPDAVAVESERGVLSYWGLEAASNRLAQQLVGLGVGVETRVAVCLERSPELVVSLLAVLKAGGAYVPVDPAYPLERQRFMVSDSGAPVLVTSGGAGSALLGGEGGSGRALAVVDLGRAAPGLGSAAETRPEVRVPGSALAYVIYTSGSTGRPKGAMNAHSGIVNRLLWMQAAYGLDGSDAVLQKTPFSFDVSVWELFWPLVTGARLVVARPGGHRESDYLVRRVASSGVTTLHFVPSMLPAFLDQAGSEGCRSLRRVIASGEALAPELAERFRRRLGSGVRLENLYGPTEAAVDVTRWSCPAEGPVGSVPIGRPIANLRTHVLDGGLRPVPLGVAGELYLGGVGVGRGYLGRPGLTAERFVPDSLARGGEGGGRLYRTGDLARHTTGGEIEYLGRIDFQVKVRGFRIELGEIESALAEHPAVRQAVATAEPGGGGGSLRLAAYVEVRGEPRPGVEELRAFLGARLPEHMVPGRFALLDELPLLPNGKADRRALAALPLDEPARGQGYVAPRDAAESALASIWGSVLGLERVGVHDNFFALGGDSILCLQMVAAAQRAGLALSLDEVFEHPTVSGLAARAAGAPSAAPDRAAGLATPAGSVDPTPIQRWFLDREVPDPHHFNQGVFLTSERPLEPARLRRAAAALAAGHDALRLRFRWREERWHAETAAPESAAPYAGVDLGALPLERFRSAVEAAAESVQASLDLARGPLFRLVHILGRSEGERLLLVAHHLVVDAVSWRLLLDDLRASYAAPPTVPVAVPAGGSWRRYAVSSAARAGSEEVRRQAGFWASEARRSRRRLPRDLAGGRDTVASARSVTSALDEGETESLLQALPAAVRAHPDEIFLAALGLALRPWSGGGLLVDLERHGREAAFAGAEAARTVGWLTVLFPVLLELESDSPAAALRVAKEALRSVPGDGSGFGLLRYAPSGADPRIASLPSADVLFNYLGRLDRGLRPIDDGGALRPAVEAGGSPRSRRQPRSHRLEVEASVRQGRLQMRWTYGAMLHREATVETLARRFSDALRGFVAEWADGPAAAALAMVPSDFPLAGIDAWQLSRLLADEPLLDDLYPLAPPQEGILFHALEAADPEVYFEQVRARLEGPLDPGAFAAAWRRVIERHGVLRSRFFWRDLERPLLGVLRSVDLPLTVLDWSGLSEAEAAGRLDRVLAEDRRRGLDPTRAPLMRLILVREGAERHTLVWSFHHAILDGWSSSRVVQEVFAFYRAEREGAPAGLPPARPFRDFIAWLERQDRAAAEAAWRRELAGFRQPTPLPEEAGPGGAGEAERRLSPEVSAELGASARRRLVTLATVVQCAWGVLLARYGGEPEVVFGATVAGRPAGLAGVEEMVGMFVNTLPVRLRVPPHRPLGEWLRDEQRRQAELRRFEQLPLAVVQRAGGFEGGRLFDSLLVVENYPVDASLRSGGGELVVAGVRPVEKTNYPLTLLVVPGAATTLRVLYDGQRFRATTVERLLGHLSNLLRGFATSDGPVDRFSLLSPAERHQVVVEANDTRRPAPAGTLHELFARAAAAGPEAVALVVEGRTWTYRRLDEESNRLARHLCAAGVRPDEPVAISLPRSAEMPVAVLAVLKAGGACLPIDPSYPALRRDLMLADSGARVLIARGAAPVPGGGEPPGPAVARRIDLDAEAAAIAARPATPPAPAVTPDNLCYVLYTSGSTGRPKGVAMPHRALVSLVRWQSGQEGGRARPTLQFASLSFDVAFQEIFSTWSDGGSLHLVDERVRRDAAELLHRIEAERIERLFLPFVVLEAVVEEDVRRGAALPRPARWITAGEQLRMTSALRELLSRTGTTLDNQYGPTEAHVVSSWRVRPDDGVLPPIGRPVDGVRLHVLDRRLEPVPIGIAGELYIGGVALARGYLGRPALTAERFVPAPVGGAPGERLYRSGDLARLRPDAALEFLGRIDDQVKVRGHRVEPGEVEAALTSLEGVRQAAVVLGSGTAAGRLIAYVVPEADPGGARDVASLRAALAARLPETMVPGLYVFLDALPTTPSGKVDRRRLPEPAASHSMPSEQPRDGVEAMVAELFADVLGIPSPGPDSDFFELGGHSLSAMRLISRLRGTFGVELPLRFVFESPTVAALARRIAASRRDPALDAVPPLVPAAGERRELPLSFAQQRLWFLDRLEPGNAAYNIATAVGLDGALDVAALARACDEIVRRHEVLRTRYVERAGRPVQVPTPWRRRALPLADLAALPPARREAETSRLATAQTARPFDLAAGRPLRPLLVRLEDRRHAVVVVLHHIAGDGWSLGILVQELAALYRGFADRGQGAAGAPELPALPLQYADFAVWQRSWLGDEALARLSAHWRRRLEGMPAHLELPLDRPRPARSRQRGATLATSLPAATAGGMRSLSRRAGVTPFVVLLAAFQVLIARRSGETRIPVGTPTAGRTRLETEGLIGCFVNTLVLATDLADDPPFDRLVARVREVVLDAHAYQDLPFEKLVEELSPARSLAHSPLFQVMFALQSAPRGVAEVRDLALTPLRFKTGSAQFDLSVSWAEIGDRYLGELEYDVALFDRSTVQRLADHYRSLLASALAAPEQRVFSLPLLAAAEVQQVEREWNDSGWNGGVPAATLEGLFAEAARSRRDAVAVADGGRALTFGALDRCSAALAGRLRAARVGPERVVAVCLRRSLALVASLLAVVRAGGAFVVLDPDDPPERLRFLLDDSGAAVLLGDGAAPPAPPGCPRIPPGEALAEGAGAAVGRGEEPAGGGVDRLACVIYTSGSTGRPKGVMVTHRSLANHLRWTQASGRMGRDGVMLSKAALTFDIAVWEIFGSLASGSRLELAPDEARRDPAVLVRLLRERGVAAIDLVPAFLREIVARPELAACNALCSVTCGGEEIGPELLRRWWRRWPAAGVRPVLRNGYGPTEATIDCIERTLTAADGERAQVPIGRPFANNRVWVVDRGLRLQPIGVVGELLLGGVGVARGYLGRPALTAERFVPDPFARAPGTRAYRSGDLARQLADGSLVFLGRIDRQVKLRGFRIELGEIESALAEHPAVRQAVAGAAGGDDGGGSPRLVAWVAVAGERPEVEGLRSFLAARLPAYMVPARFALLDALPLLPNGKVDRRALARLPLAGPAAGGGHVAPRGAGEELLCSLFAEILGADRVGVEDDFFALGGHSLLATQVIARVHEMFRIELPVRSLFENPTVAGLYRALAERLGAPEVDEIAAVVRQVEALSDEELQALAVEQVRPAASPPEEETR
jgi:amino acid adenylation domain-containing protein/non-ribosomal peptide synthase protein (TIGR01720 family)